MERERVTISIKKDLLNKIDQTIDGIVVRNRSHAIEHLASQALSPEKARNAVILLGGKGASKLIPAVKEAIVKLHENGFNKIYIALGYLADKAKSQLGDGSDFGLEIEYIEEGEGTGGAILPLKDTFTDTFIIFNPDNNIPESINKIIEFHHVTNATVTVATNDLNELKGLYVAEPNIFDNIPEGFSMLEDDVFPRLIEKNKLVVYPVTRT